jgi:hypothetical protein
MNQFCEGVWRGRFGVPEAFTPVRVFRAIDTPYAPDAPPLEDSAALPFRYGDIAPHKTRRGFVKEGVRVGIQSHLYDFFEVNDETMDMVKSCRSDNLGYVYTPAPHGFFTTKARATCGTCWNMSRIVFPTSCLPTPLIRKRIVGTSSTRPGLTPACGKSDAAVHQHVAMGEGEVDFDGIFETLRKMDFANKQFKVDSESNLLRAYFGFPEKKEYMMRIHGTYCSICHILLDTFL